VILVEKNMMKYMVLVKTISGKGGEFWEGFSKMPDEPMKGVTIESSWSLYGYWDFVIFFNADSNDNSLHFVGEVLRNVGGIGETSTSPMTVLKAHKKM
jgi:hypothetical protein